MRTHCAFKGGRDGALGALVAKHVALDALVAKHVEANKRTCVTRA